MAWEPLPLEVAEWMGMDDDHLRLELVSEGPGGAGEGQHRPRARLRASLGRLRRVLIG
ncbi:hypothetical protein [Nocardioides sp. 503]|uniref:hypothetical protein n=1 Tax=Nocardioides sp. 503 TaxID=2508326 RepID=UPI0014303ED0|nr:hypothetical protein [Nocardioides sp. 503]